MAGLSFAFDPSRGETPDTIAKKRAIAEAIAARAMSGAPRNVGEGLNAVGQALLYRQMMRRADTAQREGSQGASAAFSSLFGGNFPEAPAAPQSAPTADYPSQRVAQAHGDNPYRDAIASIESDGSGGYSAIGPTHPELGRALGRYQVMEANIGPWSKAALGREVTADEFLSDPKLQDAVFDHRFGQYVEKYGPEKAAQAWFAGEGGIGTNRQDSLGTSVPEYVQKFNRALGQGGAQRVAQAMPEMAGNTVQQPGSPDANRIMQVLSNPFLSDSQKRIAELLLNQTMQANDPMRQMQLEKGRLELEQMRNPQPKPTDDMREYEFAKGQGYEGTFQQFMTDMKKAGATTVNVGEGSGEYRKAIDKKLAEQSISIQEGAQQARSKLATLDALGSALQQSGQTGWGGETLLTVQQAGRALGLDIGDNLDAKEAARALGNQLALQLRSPSNGAGMPGAMSDKDREFLVASVPGLTKTPEGNARLIEFMKRIEQRNIEVAQLAQQYEAKNGQIDNGFFKELADWADTNPLFQEQAAAPSKGNRTRSGVQWSIED